MYTEKACRVTARAMYFTWSNMNCKADVRRTIFYVQIVTTTLHGQNTYAPH